MLEGIGLLTLVALAIAGVYGLVWLATDYRDVRALLKSQCAETTDCYRVLRVQGREIDGLLSRVGKIENSNEGMVYRVEKLEKNAVVVED